MKRRIVKIKLQSSHLSSNRHAINKSNKTKNKRKKQSKSIDSDFKRTFLKFLVDDGFEHSKVKSEYQFN